MLIPLGAAGAQSAQTREDTVGEPTASDQTSIGTPDPRGVAGAAGVGDVVVRLPPGETAGEATVAIQVAGLPQGACVAGGESKISICDWRDDECLRGRSATPPTAASSDALGDRPEGVGGEAGDARGVASPELTVCFPAAGITVLGLEGDSNCHLRVRARVANLRPHEKDDRWLVLRHRAGEETTRVQAYRVTNRHPGGVTWSLTAPAKEELVHRFDPTTRFVATVTGEAAAELRVAASSLQETDGGRKIGAERLRLEPAKPVVAPGTSRSIGLVIDGPLAPGSYEGEVSLLATGSSEVATIALTVHVSSPDRRRGGVLLIFLGVAISTLLGVFAPFRGKRLSALKAAAELRAKVEKTRASFQTAAAKEPLPRLVAACDRLLRQLTRGRLQGLLPAPLVPRVISPYDPAELEAYLEARSQRLRTLQVIDRGAQRALERWSTEPAARSAIRDALRELDALYDDELAPAPALSAVKQVLERLDKERERSGAIAPTAAPEEPTVRQLAVRIDTLNLWVWAVWFVVTLATGWAVLLMPDAGFGSTQDLWRCFLWGLGVFSVGQLTNLTPGSLRSAFNLDLPS